MVAEINVNGNQGLLTWGLGLQGVGTKTNIRVGKIVCILTRREGGIFLGLPRF